MRAIADTIHSAFMSWVTIIWSMIAAACLTQASVHGRVWWVRRSARANLFIVLVAVATAFCELWVMRVETPGASGTATRSAHVPMRRM